MLCGVLLDIDGTLLLSNDAHAHAWVDAFHEFDYDVPFEEVKPLIGMGGDKVIATVLPDLQDEDRKKGIKSRRQEIFLRRYVKKLQPAPGAREFVLKIKDSGLQPVIATSAKSAELDALLEQTGIKDIVGEKTTSDDAKESKPAPDIVHAALEKSGLGASDVIMIGDTPYDIESAGKAGVDVIAVRCGGHNDEDLKGAVAIYDNPADILGHWETSPIGEREGVGAK